MVRLLAGQTRKTAAVSIRPPDELSTRVWKQEQGVMKRRRKPYINLNGMSRKSVLRVPDSVIHTHNTTLLSSEWSGRHSRRRETKDGKTESTDNDFTNSGSVVVVN